MKITRIQSEWGESGKRLRRLFLPDKAVAVIGEKGVYEILTEFGKGWNRNGL